MAVNIAAVLDIAAALSQEGHPNSAKHLRDAVAEIERLSTERVGAQGEWQVVPVRPTLDMLAAGRVVLISSSEVWAAMLVAAPQPPDVGVEKLSTGWKNDHCNGNPEAAAPFSSPEYQDGFNAANERADQRIGELEAERDRWREHASEETQIVLELKSEVVRLLADRRHAEKVCHGWEDRFHAMYDENKRLREELTSPLEVNIEP